MIKAKRLVSVLAAAVLLPCMAVTTVTAAPSTDELEQQKAEAENEVQDLQAELTELLNKVAEMEEQLIATGEKIMQTQQEIADLKETLVVEQKTLEEQQADYQAEADHLHPRAAAPRAEPLPEADRQEHPAEMYLSPRRS